LEHLPHGNRVSFKPIGGGFLFTGKPMTNGYIKLFRSFREWYGYGNEKRVALWIELLLLASHTENRFIFNGSPVTVMPGQFITGRKKLSLATGISESYIEDLLTEFEKEGQIQQQKSTTSRMITIVKWEEYQSCDSGKTAERQPSDNGATTERQPSDTIKKVKNDKKVKNVVALDSATPHQAFVDNFGSFYTKNTGQPFKADKIHFINAARLIKSYGLEACIQKAKVLGAMCAEGERWPAKSGWADFTIENLSRNWNSIIPQVRMSDQEIKDKKFQEALKNTKENDERFNKNLQPA